MCFVVVVVVIVLLHPQHAEVPGPGTEFKPQH